MLISSEAIVNYDWIVGISWREKQITVDVSSTQIKNSPEFDPTRPIDRKYETRLYNYYGRPVYWYE